MDAVGSRMGRSSSRYGSTAVFNGPVRRWRKKWVHVSPAKPTLASSRQQAGGSGCTLVLCRWTPVSSGGGAAAADEEEQPKKRKFRYAPIAALDDQSKAAGRKSYEEATGKPSAKSNETREKRDMDEDIQGSKKRHVNLGIDLESADPENSGLIDDADDDDAGQLKKASSGGFWSTG